MQGLRLRGTISWDIFHRLSCDAQDACNESGLTIIKLEMASVLGLRRGPWGKEGNHEALVGAAREMFQRLGAEQNPLLEFFYEQICEDLSDKPLDQGSPQHYEKIWALCRKHLLDEAVIGHAPKQSRWWSVESLARRQKQLRSMTLMLLVYVGIKRKWWKELDTCPLFTGAVGESGEPEPAAGPGAPPATEADEDQPAAQRVSVAQGRAEVRKRRAQVASQMQYACRVLCRRRSLLLFDGMEHMTRPLEAAFGKMMSAVQTPLSMFGTRCFIFLSFPSLEQSWSLNDGLRAAVRTRTSAHLVLRPFKQPSCKLRNQEKTARMLKVLLLLDIEAAVALRFCEI